MLYQMTPDKRAMNVLGQWSGACTPSQQAYHLLQDWKVSLTNHYNIIIITDWEYTQRHVMLGGDYG